MSGSETAYDTIQNGDVMYRVFDNPHQKRLRIVFPYPDANVNENMEVNFDQNDWINDPTLLKSEIQIPYTRVWIAHDPELPEDDGFEIVAEISCFEDVCSYVYIGESVTFFWTSAPIELHKSYVGNSGVPKGFVANKDYVFVFAHDYKREAGCVIAVSRALIERQLGKSLSALTTDDLYDITLKIMQNPYTTVKQETLHNAYGADEGIPFDQVRFAEIMQKARHVGKRKVAANATVLGLGNVLPKNIGLEIASFRSGLHHRTYKNSVRNRNNAPLLGPMLPGFHTGVPAVEPKRKCAGCAIMGGKLQRQRQRQRQRQQKSRRKQRNKSHKKPKN